MASLLTLLFFCLAILIAASPINSERMQKLISTPTYRFSTVPGYFLQDDPDTDDTTFDPKTTNFGLKPIPRKGSNETDWQAFTRIVDDFNINAPTGTSYKVIFMGRHGEGWHNVALKYYGPVAWGVYWGRQNGNGTVNWFDAELTPKGIGEAQSLSASWQNQISEQGTPAPQSYYVSPLKRTCATSQLTFANLTLPMGRPFTPVIKENLREILGVLTSQKRHLKSDIAQSYPQYAFEAGFSEEDLLWHPLYFELPGQLDARLRELLTDVWTHDGNAWLSFTSHQLAIAALVRIVGHRTWTTDTADLLPILIKATIQP